MSLISAVTPSEAPQAGVKRSLSGNPTSIPGGLPAFRGRKVSEPSRDIKVPKLSQSNRPNEGSNIPIPYNRVCPLEFLSGWTGRLAPGDVAFVCKYPPGFLSTNPLGAGTNGTATMSRVIGLDGVNRLLHGEGNPDGWVAGGNVLAVDKGASPFKVLNVQPKKDKKTGEDILGPFAGLSVLETIRLDGIVKSNDEPYAFTSSGSRDAVVFNNIIQGPTICNNGFLLYDPRANPGYTIDQTAGTGGSTPLRTVESHPRGSVEGGYHIGGAGVGGGGVPGRVGAPWLAQNGQYDYVATFTGTFSTYPAQMFDRNVQPMNTLYLGLRAYKLSDDVRAKVRKDADSDEGSAGLGAGGANAGKDAYMFQILPFSSRKAYLCQHVQDELAKTRNEEIDKDVDSTLAARGLTIKTAPAFDVRKLREGVLASIASSDPARAAEIRAKLKDKLVRINSMMASHKRGEKKSRFDDDVFDAVRTEDLANMVGAWKVGRVLDVKAMRHASYEGGPSDTGFALMVDVQTSWQNALPLAGGSVRNATDEDGFLVTHTNELDALSRQYVEYGTNKIGRDGKETDQAANGTRKDQLAVDAYNAQFPSMRASVGHIFAQGLYGRNNVKRSERVDKNYPDSQRPPIPGSGKDYGLPPAWVGEHAHWADYDALLSVAAENHDANGVNAVDGAPSASLAPPLMPTPAPAIAPIAATTAAAASAPITAAAVAAAASAPRPGAVARSGARKSPARARPATGASAAAKAVAAAAPAPAPAPAAPAPAAPVPIAAAAAAATSAAIPEADLSASAPPPPAQRRRERGAAQTSTVSAVFDSIFGGGAEADEPTAFSAGDAPASPTPSSGSDASGTGPKTFRRPR